MLQIWNDCSDPGNPSWTPIGGVDSITFTPVITDDGTPLANTPGHDLTATAQNISGGVSPTVSAYAWKVDGSTVGTAQVLSIIQAYIGKVVTCDITVAEPAGTGAVTNTAVFAETIQPAATINTPSVLATSDGAGGGGLRYLKSDKISELDNTGGDLTSVQPTTSKRSATAC